MPADFIAARERDERARKAALRRVARRVRAHQRKRLLADAGPLAVVYGLIWLAVWR